MGFSQIAKLDPRHGVEAFGIAADYIRHGYWMRNVDEMDIEGYPGTYMEGFDEQFDLGGSKFIRGLGPLGAVGVGILDYNKYTQEGESPVEALIRASGRAGGGYGGAEAFGDVGCGLSAAGGPIVFGVVCGGSILVGGLAGEHGGGIISDAIANQVYGQ